MQILALCNDGTSAAKEVIMNALAAVKSQLEPGHVYRRADLERWSNAVDRHVKQLVLEGTLKKLSGGLYLRP